MRNSTVLYAFLILMVLLILQESLHRGEGNWFEATKLNYRGVVD